MHTVELAASAPSYYKGAFGTTPLHARESGKSYQTQFQNSSRREPAINRALSSVLPQGQPKNSSSP